VDNFSLYTLLILKGNGGHYNMGEIAEMWDFARRAGFSDQLKALHRPRPWRSISAALLDWLLIATAVAAPFWLGWWLIPLSVLLIGNRQRALGNLLHDASHYSFHQSRKWSRWLANTLLCWPLCIHMPLYRAEHNAHHRYLADPERDTDYIHDDCQAGTRWPRILWRQLSSAAMFRNALLGHVGKAGLRAMAGSVLWWCCIPALVGALFSATHALVFVSLWLISRATSFHAITAFREISDHVGLAPGSLVGFSRNHPFNSIAGQLFHPHNNGYHLLHHLAPRLPFHAFPRAHGILLAWPRYAQASQCHSYFLGEDAAVKSWQLEALPT